MKILSIIVPIYNVDLNELIDLTRDLIDLANQRSDIDVYLIDDKCPKNSLIRLQEKLSDVGKIKYIWNENNLGKSKTITKYIKEIESKFLFVIDAGDQINLEEMYKTIDALYNDDSTIVFLDWFYKNHRKTASRKKSFIGTNKKVIPTRTTFFNSNIIFNTKDFLKYVEAYPPSLNHILADKWDALYISAIPNLTFSYYKLAPYIYVKYGTSRPSDLIKKIVNLNLAIYEIMRINIINKDTEKFLARQLFRQAVSYIIMNVGFGESYKKAYREARNLIKVNPSLEAIYEKTPFYRNMFKYSQLGGFNYLMTFIARIIIKIF